MNEFKKESFRILDMHVHKQIVGRSNWWTRLLNWLRGVESKSEYIWTVRITVDRHKNIEIGDFFASASESLYKVRGKLGPNIIAVSTKPLEEHGITNPCILIKKK